MIRIQRTISNFRRVLLNNFAIHLSLRCKNQNEFIIVLIDRKRQEMDSTPTFSAPQLEEYQSCPDIKYLGFHVSGLTGCFYCAEIFRRYRKQEGTLDKALESDNKAGDQETEAEAEEDNIVNSQPNRNRKNDDDEECGKLECMRAGWCMCG